MSDSSRGPGWWQASDGKWYAPEQHPGSAPQLPPPTPAVTPQPPAPPIVSATPFGAPGGATKKPWWRRWWAIAIAAVVGLAVVVGIFGADEQKAGAPADPTVASAIDGTIPQDGPAASDPTTWTEDDAGAGVGEADQPDTTVSPPTTAPSPESGSRANPFPIGRPVSITIDSFGDGDGSIWTLVVDGPGTDLTRAVAAENQFNDPPPDGSIFYGVPVTVTLDAAEKEPLSTLFNLEFEFFGPATLSIIDQGFDEGCGVTPDQFDPFTEVFIGGSLSGIICLTVTNDDLTGGVLLTTDSIEGDRIYFATSGDRADIDSDDEGGESGTSGTVDDPPRPDNSSDEPGSRANPFPIGRPVSITIDSFGDGDGSIWTLVVDGPGTDLTRAVAAENQFNDPPPDGSIFYGVPVTVTLDAAEKEPLSTLFNLEFEFFGPATLSIIDQGFDEGCGVTPDGFDPFTEVFVGGSLSGIICLTVTNDDLTGGVLLTTDSIEGDRIYFATS